MEDLAIKKQSYLAFHCMLLEPSAFIPQPQTSVLVGLLGPCLLLLAVLRLWKIVSIRTTMH